MRILIADDDFFTRITLKTTMEKYGNCDMVVNGLEAVEIFSEGLSQGQPYRLVLLDIQMPEMDGVAALIQIRQLEKDANVPPRDEAIVFMVTAMDTAAYVVKAFMEGGCTDYITKSAITTDELFSKMREHKLIPV